VIHSYKKIKNYILIYKIFECSHSFLIDWVNKHKIHEFFVNKKAKYNGYKNKKNLH